MFKEIKVWESEAKREVGESNTEWFKLGGRHIPEHGDVIVFRSEESGIYPYVVLVNTGDDSGMRYQHYNCSSSKISVSGSTKPVYWKLIHRDRTPPQISPAELAEWRAYFKVRPQNGNG